MELLSEDLCKKLTREFEKRTNPYGLNPEKPRVVLRELLQMTYSWGRMHALQVEDTRSAGQKARQEMSMIVEDCER